MFPGACMAFDFQAPTDAIFFDAMAQPAPLGGVLVVGFGAWAAQRASGHDREMLPYACITAVQAVVGSGRAAGILQGAGLGRVRPCRAAGPANRRGRGCCGASRARPRPPCPREPWARDREAASAFPRRSQRRPWQNSPLPFRCSSATMPAAERGQRSSHRAASGGRGAGACRSSRGPEPLERAVPAAGVQGSRAGPGCRGGRCATCLRGEHGRVWGGRELCRGAGARQRAGGAACTRAVPGDGVFDRGSLSGTPRRFAPLVDSSTPGDSACRAFAVEPRAGAGLPHRGRLLACKQPPAALD